ncbi:alpha/beta hydrolase [Cereibacter sphaeroides]|uniref:alpha/beta fold hydrolase n=1 Tax=Cereibacter sphaeroides TaxID=1063 RepID=UPI000F53B03F|nr:alpha/beta hydrolase [Cereibacter sphaeroides]AZB54608.1 alpha/beta hydrolase [Cereibacter sphaeroides]AZB61057.1 alpha/beta hydrolase [Cereibacter sphaeroides]
MAEFFEGFTEQRVKTSHGEIRVRCGGSGFPILLLHGHPRTHTTWFKVAPQLARDFSVVCADMPGFGQSYQPDTLAGSSARAKAAALRDCMALLGHGRFGVAGHDRGSYRAFRLAMDFPEEVAGLVVMDGVPIYEALSRADWRFAKNWFHWFFFAQSEKAEAAITACPDLWYPADAAIGLENNQDYMAATRRPDVVRGMLADYRAGLEFDFEDDRQDREAGRRLRCPLGVLWSLHDDMEQLYGDPSGPWAEWSDRIVMRRAIASGHHMAEEAPHEVAEQLRLFFAGIE